MARARTKAQREPAPRAEEARRAAHPAPQAEPSSIALARASGLAPGQAQRLQAAGNTAVRRTLAERVTPSAPSGGPQRLWDRAEFAKRTAEGYFTKKSHAQKTVEQLLDAYNALPADPATPAHANLLEQMVKSASFWIDDHTAEAQGPEASGDASAGPAATTPLVDPNRKKRMQGFQEFRHHAQMELEGVRLALGASYTPGMGEEHAAFKKLTEHYKGSADSLFTKAATVLDKAVSTPGEGAKVEIEFELPVDPSGAGFIGGRLTIEASREDDMSIKSRTEMVVTGGAKVGIAKIKGELGGYIEAQAPTARDVMNLYSYGLYRRFRESSAIPAGMTNYLWGGSTASYGKAKSEAWSRDLEKQLFTLVPLPDQNDATYQSISNPAKRKEKYEADLADAEAAREKVKNTYVATGGVAAGKGQLGLSSVAEMTLGVKYTSGKKITAESIVAAKGAAGAANKDKTRGFGQKSLGADVSAISGAVGLTVGPVEGKLTVVGSGEKRKVEFELGGKVPAALADGVPAYLADVAVSGIKLYRTLQAADSKTETLGPLMALGSFQKSLVGTPVHGALTGQGLSAAGDVGLKFVATMERNDGKWTGDLELKHVSELGTDLADGALKVKLEKESRLAKWSYGPSGWSMS